jgi:hypothetical protein
MSMRRCLIDVETRVTNDIESDTSRRTRYSMIRSPGLPKGPVLFVVSQKVTQKSLRERQVVYPSDKPM